MTSDRIKDIQQETISITDEQGKEYKFEKPDFECDLLKAVGNTIYGIVYDKQGRDYAQQWDKRDGESFEFSRIGDSMHNLTPIKKQWYEDEELIKEKQMIQPNGVCHLCKHEIEHGECISCGNSDFVKNDCIKPPLGILADVKKALEDVSYVMEHGAEKYSRCNWKKVDDTERYISASLRHILSYKEDKTDEDSGLPHLAHAICSLLFVLELDNEDGSYKE